MRIGLAVLLSVIVGCSSPDSRSGFEGKGPDGTQGSFGTKDGFGSDDGGSPTTDGCAAEARLVYVVSQENDLYSFAPSTTTFTKVGRLECPTIGSPNSMAVDRSGTAWVNYSDGSLFRVSTKDASCTETSYVPGQGGYLRFGMAFATNGANTTAETLYVAGIESFSGSSKAFGKIDLQTMKLVPLGNFSGKLAGRSAELTGTGEGHLFGFFTTDPYATLAEIDEPTGATSNDRSLQGVRTGSAWAFSFWGGDFWFYTSDGLTPSQVTRLETSGSGKISVAKDDVGGFRIVGAGVSTCAPVAPPR